MLTPGQDHDLTCAEPLIENADPEALIGDKAYDADPFVETLTQRGITPVIPPKANRNIKRECDFALYCERNLIERFFNRLKHFRAIATRYDKLARNFLAGVQLAAVQSCSTEYGPCRMLLQLSKHRGRLLAPFFDYVESEVSPASRDFCPPTTAAGIPLSRASSF